MKDMGAEVVGRTPMELHPCGGGRAWGHDPLAGGVRVVEPEQALLLEALEGFRPLDEHVVSLMEQGFGEAGAEELAAQIGELRREGLALSVEELVARMPQTPGEEDPRIGWAAWVTRDRAALAERAVRSWLDRAGEGGPRLAVIDDSEDDETRAVARRIGAEGVGLWYCGRPEKQRFAARLAAAGIPAEVVADALAPATQRTTCGANRNALLLATAGEAVLSSDDDVVMRVASLPEREHGLSIASLYDPAGIRYSRDREALLACVEPAAESPAAAHEALLGRLAGDCARRSDASLDMRNLGLDLARKLTTRPCRVRITASGIYGDSALRHPSLMYLRGEWWDRVTESEEQYRAAAASRETVRAVPRSTIGDPGYLMGGHLGLDNRSLLPPFLPEGRRSDGIFALTLRVVDPEALAASLPLAVLHDPPPVSVAATDPPPQPGSADLLMLLIAACSPPAGWRGPEERLAELGRRLAEMAALDAAELERWVRERWLGQWAGEIDVCEQRAQSGGRGAPWAADARERLQRILQHVEGGAAVFPYDLAAAPEEAWGRAKDLMRRFAGVLQWWPAMVEEARRLNTRGEGLLQPLKG